MARSHLPPVLRAVLFAGANAILLAIAVYGVNSLRHYPGLGFGWSAEHGTVVASTVPRNSEAYRVGIRRGDVVSRVETIITPTPAHLELALLDRAPGDSVTLVLTRDGRMCEVPIVLSARHGIGLIVVTSILGGLFWAVAVFVYAKRPQEYASRVFAWTMILLGATIMMVWPGHPRPGALWGFTPPLLYLVAYTLIPPSILLFFLVYPTRKSILPHGTAFLLFIPAPVFGYLLTVSYLRAITFRSVTAYESYLSRYGLFRIYLAIYLLLSLIALFHSRTRARTRADRHKVQWILLGIVVGAFPFVALWSIPQATGNPPLITEEVSYLFMMLIPLAFTFSIVRYHALDIEVIVSRGIGYAVVSGMVIALYLGIAGLTGVMIHSSVMRGGKAILAACTLLSALLFAPLRNRVQNIVDRTFYRTRYSYRVAMQDLGAAVKAAPTRRGVVALLRDKISGVIPLEILVVAACEPEASKVEVVESVGVDSAACDTLRSLMNALRCSDRVSPLPQSVRDLGVEVVLPIVIQGNVLGYVAAGKLRSGGSLTDDDIDLLRDMGGEAFMAVERLRLQESVILEHAHAERLGELSQLKSEFMAHVSHELRTPLTSIRWSVENLLDGIPEETGPRVREYLVGIHESSSRLARMIENLLDATRIEAGRTDLSLEPIDLCDAVKASLDVVRPVAERTHIALNVACTEGLRIVGDRHSVQTILINLLDNAIKYSPQGTTVTLETRPAGPSERLSSCASAAAIAVRDEGIGIPAERLDAIFEPFERVRNDKVNRERGLGLGLHIVKGLVAQHAGRIMVDSTPGIGSTFVVVLPRAA